MSELLSLRNRQLLAGALAATGFLALNGCASSSSNEGNSGGTGYYPPAPDKSSKDPLQAQVDKAIADIQGQVKRAQCAQVINIDSDCDGTADKFDMSPLRRDFVDSDGDYVTDQFDKHPGINDYLYDSDHDGIIDAYDLYNNVNDQIDSDGDGIPNGDDYNYLVPQAPGTNQDLRLMPRNLAYYAQVNEQMKTYYDNDGTDMLNAYESKAFTDSDHDGAYDLNDHAPTDPSVGGSYNAYINSTDAWVTDENNGWDQ